MNHAYDHTCYCMDCCSHEMRHTALKATDREARARELEEYHRSDPSRELRLQLVEVSK